MVKKKLSFFTVMLTLSFLGYQSIMAETLPREILGSQKDICKNCPDAIKELVMGMLQNTVESGVRGNDHFSYNSVALEEISSEDMKDVIQKLARIGASTPDGHVNISVGSREILCGFSREIDSSVVNFSCFSTPKIPTSSILN